jgi:hypothetical protein
MKYAVLWILFSILTLGAGSLIKRNDRQFPAGVTHRNSMILEWTFSPATSRAIVKDWKDHHAESIAYSGLLLDTLLFIPLYVCGMLALVGWAARGELRFLPLAVCVFLTGAFDCLENLGSFIQVRYDMSGLAWQTGSVAMLKWLFGVTTTIVAIRSLFRKDRV